MKVVIQRVGRTALSVGGEPVSEIPFGLAVYFGVKQGDTEAQVEAIVRKIAALRVFEDSLGKMNLSVKDVKGEILLISQFTLYGDCSHGNRPSFTEAARPEIAKPLYDLAAKLLAETGVPVKTGVFGADMTIDQQNLGPVTIVYEI